MGSARRVWSSKKGRVEVRSCIEVSQSVHRTFICASGALSNAILSMAIQQECCPVRVFAQPHNYYGLFRIGLRDWILLNGQRPRSFG